MLTSQNKWPVLAPDSPQLHLWFIPTRHGVVKINMRNGSAGFALAMLVMWYANHIEPVIGKVLDDWGYSDRNIRGSSTQISNHASGTAVDLNATQHPLGRVGTLPRLALIHLALKTRFRGIIRSGADYHGRKDEMHWEIVVPLERVERWARRMLKSKAGKHLISFNKEQLKVINS